MVIQAVFWRTSEPVISGSMENLTQSHLNHLPFCLRTSSGEHGSESRKGNPPSGFTTS